MPDVVMPRLSDSMEEGTILRWLKADGETVHRGEPLVEIETDKANMTYDADSDGSLEILAPEGETLAIGELIARIRAQGDGAATAAATAPAARAEPPTGIAATPAPAPSAGPEPHVSAPAPISRPAEGGRIKASPLARRIARERGVDLGALSGSGPGGRIVRADVEAADPAAGHAESEAHAHAGADPDAGAGAGAEPAADAPPTEVGTAKGDVRIVEPTRTQRVIARRMAESRATIPDFALRITIDMEGARELRERLRLLDVEGPLPSYNDMVVKACALALREFPRVNAAYRDAHFELYSRVNVGIAVAGDDSLTVPTLFDADRKSLGEIARESRALAQRVRSAAITPPELSGATFTVSNLGMFGIDSFNAVINPPQAAILAVGAIAARPHVHDGRLAARATMGATLACDHRILYGAEAARFLARVRQLLEEPSALSL